MVAPSDKRFSLKLTQEEAAPASQRSEAVRLKRCFSGSHPMSARRFGLLATFALLQSLFALGRADAGAVSYGDFSDIPPGAVMYLDVTESSATDPVPPPLFGAPSINVNTLDFDPKGFAAYSTNGHNDITDGQLNFVIMTLDEYDGQPTNAGITSIEFREGGDFTLGGTGTAVTEIGGGIAVMVDILAADGMLLDNPISLTASASFNDDLGGGEKQNSPWGLSLTVDFANALAGLGKLGVTKAKISLDDTLFAISEMSSVSLIAKKDFQIIPTGNHLTTEDIPEPGTLGLISLAAIGLILRRQRVS
ncbi:MAG: PEP-CTERM sorting domain-containing protein [Pirellulales bacterium]